MSNWNRLYLPAWLTTVGMSGSRGLPADRRRSASVSRETSASLPPKIAPKEIQTSGREAPS